MMKSLREFIIPAIFKRGSTLLLIAALVIPARADFNSDSRGTTAATFLQVGSGARNAALGDGVTAIVDEPNTVFTNPGGMAIPRTPAFTLGHSIGFEDSFHDIGAGVWPIGKRSALGVGVIYSGTGKVNETDANAIDRGTFSPNDQAAVVGFAHNFDALSFGGSLKYIRSTILDTAQTFATDFGVTTHKFFNDHVRFGAAAANIGGKLKYESESEPLPMTVRGGATANFDKLSLTADIVFPKNNAPYAAGGIEWVLATSGKFNVIARGGYNGERGQDASGNGFSGGVGLKLADWQLDYSLVTYGELGSTNLIALTYSFPDPMQASASKTSVEETAVTEPAPVVEPAKSEPSEQAIPLEEEPAHFSEPTSTDEEEPVQRKPKYIKHIY